MGNSTSRVKADSKKARLQPKQRQEPKKKHETKTALV